jgi:hypothetical protein
MRTRTAFHPDRAVGPDTVVVELVHLFQVGVFPVEFLDEVRIAGRR